MQWPVTQLFGLIRASINQLEERLQEVERSNDVERREEFVVQTCRMQETHDKIQVQRKLERVQERLAKAWPDIQNFVPELPKVSDAGELEHQIELLQGAWTQLATQAEQLKTQLQ
jgi:hypothetical protein